MARTGIRSAGSALGGRPSGSAASPVSARGWRPQSYLIVNVAVKDGPGPPGFVYGIIGSLFVFFNSFAINQWLQYKQVGRWQDYLTGERTYIVLSLVAKSLLAWQVFANVLVG